jgi:hypothetical protein
VKQEQGYAGKILDWFHFSRSMEATLADYLANETSYDLL